MLLEVAPGTTLLGARQAVEREVGILCDHQRFLIAGVIQLPLSWV